MANEINRLAIPDHNQAISPYAGGMDNYLSAMPSAPAGNPMGQYAGQNQWQGQSLNWGQQPNGWATPNLWPGTGEERNAWMPWGYSQTTTRQGGDGLFGGLSPINPNQNEDPDRPNRWDPQRPNENRLALYRGQPSGGRYGWELESSVPWDYHKIEGYDPNGPNWPPRRPGKNLGPRGEEQPPGI